MDEGTEVQTAGQQDKARSTSEGARPNLPGYELERAIGQGAFGEVWSALQLRTGQRVAVKLFGRGQNSQWGRFQAELERLGEVAEHPYVVGLLDADLQHDPAFLVMPLLPTSLSAELARERPPLERVVEWLEQMALALRYMHGKGILHCDFKPSNVLLDEEGRVRIADFGQSLRRDDQVGNYGTLGFMAPEQAGLGTEKPGSQPSVLWDVYGWGATAYFLLSGRCPRLSAQDLAELGTHSVRQRLQEYPARLAASPLRRLKGGVDSELAALVESCLQLDPDRRPQSMDQVLQDLQRRLQGEPLLCRRPWPWSYRLRKWVARPLVGLSLVFLALGGLGVGLAFGRQRAQLAEMMMWRANEAERAGRSDEACLWWAAAENEKPGHEYARLRLSSYLTPLRAVVAASGAYALTWSPDGRWLLVGQKEGAVVLDSSGRQRFRLQGVSRLRAAAFSPDSQHLWVRWGQWSNRVWEVPGGRPTTPVLGDPQDSGGPGQQPERDDGAAWSADGRWIACHTGAGQVQAFVAEDGRPVTPVLPNPAPDKEPDSHYDAPLSSENPLAWAANGKSLLAGASLWEIPGGRRLARLDPAPGTQPALSAWGAAWMRYQGDKGVVSLLDLSSLRQTLLQPGADLLRFSPDGGWLFAGRYDASSEVRRMRGGEGLRSLPRLPRGTIAVDFSQDGSHLAWMEPERVNVQLSETQWSCNFQLGELLLGGHIQLSRDGHRVLVYNFSRCRVFSTTGIALTPWFPCSDAASLSPDGQSLAVASDCLRLWSLQAVGVLDLPHGSASEVEAAFSPVDERWASAADGQLRMWNRRGEVLWRQPLGDTGWLGFAPDGQRLAAWLRGPMGQQRLQVWDRDGHQLVTDAPLEGALGMKWTQGGWLQAGRRLWSSRDGRLVCDQVLALSPEGRFLVGGGGQWWDLSKSDTGHRALPADLQLAAFSRDGRRLASFDGRHLQLWALPELVALGSPLDCPSATHLEFDATSQYLLVSDTSAGRLLDVKGPTWVPGSFPPGDDDPVFSPDGRWLVTRQGQLMQLWDNQGRPVGPALVNVGRVQPPVFTPDSRQLLAVSDDGVVRRWLVPSGAAQPPLDLGFDPGSQSPVVSPDGRFLAVGGELYDLDSGSPWRQARGQRILFAPDGGHFLSLGEDGMVRLFSLRARPRSEWAESWTGRRLVPSGDALWLGPGQWTAPAF